MASFDVAYISERGQDLIVVPLSWADVHNLKAEDREGFRLGLELCARTAGMKGTVCLVWEYGGAMYYYAPSVWTQLFDSLTMGIIVDSINGTLTCNSSIHFSNRALALRKPSSSSEESKKAEAEIEDGIQRKPIEIDPASSA